MGELMRPFVRAWEWVDYNWGFPGKVLAIVIIVIGIFGLITWVGNRK